MPAEFFTRRTFSLREHLPALVERVVTFDVPAAPPAVAVAPAHPAATAHQAVATVLDLVETHDARTQAGTRSVTLQFKVAGEDLAVRVELREGAVHTQFRTDSPELRMALAREWQAVSAQTPDRPVRLIEPTFAPSAHGDSLLSRSDDGAPRHHAPPQQREPVAPSAGLARRGPAVTAETSLVTPRGPVAVPTALHLSAFA